MLDNRKMQFFLYCIIFACAVHRIGAQTECFDGSLWDAAQQEQNVSIWRDAIYSTGLNIILADPKPGEALFLPLDIGLFNCTGPLDPACAIQRFNWYTLLTNKTAVGLLLQHWIPGDWSGSGISPADLNNITTSQTSTESLQTMLTHALVKTQPGDKHDIKYGKDSTGQNIIMLSNGNTLDSFNGVPFGSSSKILKTVTTCSGSTLFIIDKPIIPANLPESSVNDLPALADFCWTNFLNYFQQPQFKTAMWTQLLAIFFPESMPVLANPRQNVTYLISDGELFTQIWGDVFAELAQNDPVTFSKGLVSKYYSNMLSAGYCPESISGKPMNTLIGEMLGKDMPITINYTPESNEVYVVSPYANVTGQYAGSFCYSQFYYMQLPAALWPDPTGSVDLTEPMTIYDLNTVESDSLMFGVEAECRDDAMFIKQADEYTTSTTVDDGGDDNSDGLSTGAIVGISVGSVAVAGLIGAGLVARHKRKQQETLLPSYLNQPGRGWGNLFGWSSSSGSQGSSSDWDGNGKMPAVPWNDFVLQAEDVDFDIDPVTKERVVLGKGRFGVVYSGKINNNSQVAIKCIGQDSVAESDLNQLSKLSRLDKDSSMKDDDSKSSSKSSPPLSPAELKEHKAILQEVALLKACRSPSIVNFYGVVFNDNQVQLVTELMTGGDLWNALRKGRINWYNGGNNIAMDVAAGLRYLHKHRVLHLDLKSCNILLTNDEQPIATISDVGLARIIPASDEYLASGSATGSWHWVSPEVILGQRCGPPADVFSFGVVLWEICSGEPPVRGRLRPINSPEECPQEILDLMHACWLEKPSDRPTAEQISSVLQKHTTRPPVSSASITPSTSGPSSTEKL